MNKYYFGYFQGLREVGCMKWLGDMPVHTKPIAGTKVELTQEEIELPLYVLEVRYPYTGKVDI